MRAQRDKKMRVIIIKMISHFFIDFNDNGGDNGFVRFLKRWWLMDLKCLKCGCDKAVKNGFVGGVQRYKCKKCGYQYTKTKPHGHSDQEKRTAVVLYASGMSMSVIARLIGVSVQTVSRWMKTFYTEYLDEIPKMEQMKRVKLKQILAYLSALDEEDLNCDHFVLGTELPNGNKVHIIIESSNPVKRKCCQG